MRLHCPVPFISRLLTKEMTIDGKTLPKNSVVDIQIYNLHHNPQIWKNDMVNNCKIIFYLHKIVLNVSLCFIREIYQLYTHLIQILFSRSYSVNVFIKLGNILIISGV